MRRGIRLRRSDGVGSQDSNEFSDPSDLSPQPFDHGQTLEEDEIIFRRNFVERLIQSLLQKLAGTPKDLKVLLQGEQRATLPDELSELDQTFEKFLDDFIIESIFSGDRLSFESFCGKEEGPSSLAVCGKRFASQDVVYSCKECAFDNTCVLCSNCFVNSAHTGHDYRMSVSGGGGVCDCGDKEAWKTGHACRLHGALPELGKVSEPDKADAGIMERAGKFLRFTCRMAEQLLLLSREDLPVDIGNSLQSLCSNSLICYVTMLYNDEVHSFEDVIRSLTNAVPCSTQEANVFAEKVDKFGRTVVYCGTRSRAGVVKEQVHERSIHDSAKHVALRVHALPIGLVCMQQATIELLNRVSTKLLPVSAQLQRLTLSDALAAPSFAAPQGQSSNTILDSFLVAECMLWKAARSAIYQLFLASSFAQPECRRTFGLAFGRHYCELMRNFIQDSHHHRDSVTAMSVQLLTVPSLVYELTAELDFPSVIVKAIRSAIEPAITMETDHEILVPSKLQARAESLHKPHLYQIYDFRYVLRSLPQNQDWSPAVEASVIRGVGLFAQDILLPFTGCDAISRRTGDHVEWDPIVSSSLDFQESIHPIAFLIADRLSLKVSRLECVLVNILPILEKSLKANFDCSNLRAVKVILSSLPAACMPALQPSLRRSARLRAQESFTVEGAYCSKHSVTTDSVSMYIALPRLVYDLFARAYSLGLDPWNFPPSSLLDPVAFVEPALRVVALSAQVHVGMWRRNGLAIVNQMRFYRHHATRCHLYELDVLGLQLAAVCPAINIDHYCIRLVEKFGLLPWLQQSLAETTGEETALLQRFGGGLVDELLLLFIHLLTERFRPGLGQGISKKDAIRHVIIQTLGPSPIPHSELREKIHAHADDSTAETLSEQVVIEVAEPRRQQTDGKTLFELKSHCFDEINPFTYCLERTELTRLEQRVRDLRRAKSGGSSDLDYLSFLPTFLPSFLPPFDAFSRAIFSSPVFLEMIHVILRNVLSQDASAPPSPLHLDSHVDKALFLLAVAAREQNVLQPGKFRFADSAAAQPLFATLRSIGTSVFQTKDSKLNLTKAQSGLLRVLLSELVPSESAPSGVDMEPAEKRKADEAAGQVMLAEASTSGSSPEMAARTEKARQHRERLMAKMAKLQKSFLETHPDLIQLGKGAEDAMSDTSTVSASVPTASPMEVEEQQQQMLQANFLASFDDALCMVCQDVCRPSVLSLFGRQELTAVKAGPQAQNNGPPVGGYVACVQRANSSPVMPNASSSANGKHAVAAYTSICTHVIHAQCWQRYLESQHARSRQRNLANIISSILVGGSLPQQNPNQPPQPALPVATCPLCESLCNTFIPLVDTRPFMATFGQPRQDDPVNAESVLVGACRTVLSASNIDSDGLTADYELVNAFPVNKSLSSPLNRGPREDALSVSLVNFSRAVATCVAASSTLPALTSTGASSSSSSGSSASTPPAMPNCPDALSVVYISNTLAETARCVDRLLTMTHPPDDSESPSLKRNLDCLLSIAQTGVTLALGMADRFCAKDILTVLTKFGYNGTDGNINRRSAGDLLCQLWLLEPLVRNGMESPAAHRRYAADAFLLSLLFETTMLVSNGSVKLPNTASQQSSLLQEILKTKNSLDQIVALSTTAPAVVPPVPSSDLLTALQPFLRLSNLLAMAIFCRPLCSFRRLTERGGLGYFLTEMLRCPEGNLDVNDWLSAELAGTSNLVLAKLVHHYFTRLSAVSNLLSQPSARSIIELPSNFADLLTKSAEFVCPASRSGTDETASSSGRTGRLHPAICLLCSTWLCGTACQACAGNRFSTTTVPLQILRHVLVCGGGRGVLLRVHDCRLLFVLADSSGRSTVSPIEHTPPYTDRYGEPDPGLHRGNPLHLSEERYAELRRLWVSHGLIDASYRAMLASGRPLLGVGNIAAPGFLGAGEAAAVLAAAGIDPEILFGGLDQA